MAVNKLELIDIIVERSELNKKNVKMVIDILFETIAENMIKGEVVNIKGFGKFIMRKQETIEKIDSETQEKLIIPEHLIPVFKASAELKDNINN